MTTNAKPERCADKFHAAPQADKHKRVAARLNDSIPTGVMRGAMDVERKFERILREEYPE